MRGSAAVLARICRIIFCLCLIPLLFLLLCATPMLFGFQPMCAVQTDLDGCPEGSLIYARYTPAEEIVPGDAIVISQNGNAVVYTVTDRSGADRVYSTKEEEYPFELVCGRLADIYIPGLGILLRTVIKPVWLCILVLVSVLSALGAFWLPNGFMPQSTAKGVRISFLRPFENCFCQ